MGTTMSTKKKKKKKMTPVVVKSFAANTDKDDAREGQHLKTVRFGVLL